MLCQLTTVKDELGIGNSDTTDDVRLTRLIKHASELFDQFCNRTFARAAGVIHEFRGDEMEISIKSYPIETLTSFELKNNETAGWEIQSGIGYVLRSLCIVSLNAPLGTAQDQARITYTGGYVLPGTSPGANQMALPTAIEDACVRQVCHWYRSRNTEGVASASTGGSSIAWDAKSPLLPVVQFDLQGYRRMQL